MYYYELHVIILVCLYCHYQYINRFIIIISIILIIIIIIIIILHSRAEPRTAAMSASSPPSRRAQAPARMFPCLVVCVCLCCDLIIFVLQAPAHDGK